MTYFNYAMISHMWEEEEPLPHNIQNHSVYELHPVGGIVKSQSFCKIARAAGYQWAWIDICCVDQSNRVDFHESAGSKFLWYSRSALTVVHLSDVPSSSVSGALAKSAWNTRGWALPEFMAARVVLFYQKDWTLYLDDHSPNHKESIMIMQELEAATGIDAQTLIAFRPGMRGARQILQWASRRITTSREDILYSLGGMLDVYLPVIYGERKEHVLGRLLQEVISQSGDITALDWVGKSSEFNSCLSADLVSYQPPVYTLRSLSEDEMQTSFSSLQGAGVADLALHLYTTLDRLTAPRFAARRLHLPCIVFQVTTMVIQRRDQEQETHRTYVVKANGLHDVAITTKDKLTQFSPTRPTRQTFLLVRPWNRDLLEVPNFADDMQDPSADKSDTSLGGAGPPGKNEVVDLDPYSRALRLVIRLGLPFHALLLGQER